MDLSRILNTPSPPPQQKATREASAQRQSADAPGSSVADKGKQRITSVSREEHAAAMTVRDRGAKHRLYESPPESGFVSKQPRLQASNAAPAQDESLSFTPAGPASTIAGSQAFTAARSFPTSLQTPQVPPSAPQALASSAQSSAHAVQAMAQRQADQSEPTIPSCYRDMDHWKETVKGMVQAKRDSRRLVWTNEERAAIAELFDASKMLITPFSREILRTESTSSATQILKKVKEMKDNGTLPQPWRPSPDPAPQNPPA